MNQEGFTLIRDGVKHHSMRHNAHDRQSRSVPSSGTCYRGLYGFRTGTLWGYSPKHQESMQRLLKEEAIIHEKKHNLWEWASKHCKNQCKSTYHYKKPNSTALTHMPFIKLKRPSTNRSNCNDHPSKKCFPEHKSNSNNKNTANKHHKNLTNVTNKNNYF